MADPVDVLALSQICSLSPYVGRGHTLVLPFEHQFYLLNSFMGFTPLESTYSQITVVFKTSTKNA